MRPTRTYAAESRTVTGNYSTIPESLGGGSSAGVDRHHAEKTSEEGGTEDPST